MKSSFLFLVIILSSIYLMFDSNFNPGNSSPSQIEIVTLNIEMGSWYFTVYEDNGVYVTNLTSILDVLVLYSSITTFYIFNFTNPGNEPNSHAHSIKFSSYTSPEIAIGGNHITDPIGFSVGETTTMCNTGSCGIKNEHSNMKFILIVIDKPISTETTIANTESQTSNSSTLISTNTTEGTNIIIYISTTIINTETTYIVLLVNETETQFIETIIVKTEYNLSIITKERTTRITQKLSEPEFIMFLLSFLTFSLFIKNRRKH